MKAEYKNWVPKGMIAGFGAATAVFTAAALGTGVLGKAHKLPLTTALAVVAIGCGAFTAWCTFAHKKFSYDGNRKLSKQIVEGTAEYVSLPDGGIGLDVGCGSGALTIACAKRNPNATILGIDRWGKEYAKFSKKLCEDNANYLPPRHKNSRRDLFDYQPKSGTAVAYDYAVRKKKHIINTLIT